MLQQIQRPDKEEMTTMTLQERFAIALRSLGSVQDQMAASRKYLVFSHNRPEPRAKGYKFYLGKSGALRVGLTIAGSRACSETFRAQLLALADRIHTMGSAGQ